jgi:uncharacterized membrane protein YuzA (DUF378 family)
MNTQVVYILMGIAMIAVVLYAALRLNQKQEDDILKKL